MPWARHQVRVLHVFEMCERSFCNSHMEPAFLHGHSASSEWIRIQTAHPRKGLLKKHQTFQIQLAAHIRWSWHLRYVGIGLWPPVYEFFDMQRRVSFLTRYGDVTGLCRLLTRDEERAVTASDSHIGVISDSEQLCSERSAVVDFYASPRQHHSGILPYWQIDHPSYFCSCVYHVTALPSRATPEPFRIIINPYKFWLFPRTLTSLLPPGLYDMTATWNELYFHPFCLIEAHKILPYTVIHNLRYFFSSRLRWMYVRLSLEPT